MSPCRNRTETANLRPLPQLIFGSRWLQLPLYLGLIVAQGVYVVQFLKELWHLHHACDIGRPRSRSCCWCWA